MIKYILFIICSIAFFITQTKTVLAQNNFSGNYPQQQLKWVEEKLESMTLEEKIGQLFMVAAYSNRDDAHKQELSKLIKEHHIGGLIFFQGTPEAQVKLTNHYQLISKTPLLIAIDGEWGLSMRLSDTPKYPRQLMLGAIQDNQLIYDMGKDMARQCKRMGIHINLAPVVDVNNNPNNPVINDRSFGENKENVATKSIAYMQGMELNGILACAKHFPGHGDTDKDSHHTLPVINHSKERLNEIELYPFREMIQNGVSGIMTAHLAIPALDNSRIKEPFTEGTPTIPASLSKKIITYLLKNDLNYEGLIFTDALNMKGVSDFFGPGEVALKALLAGNDILLFPEDVKAAVAKIKEAIQQGDITEDDIEYSVRKILKAKFRVGLNKFKPISSKNLLTDLNTVQSELLIRDLVKNALTVAKNEKRILPIMALDQQDFASVSLGSKEKTVFQTTLSKYTKVDHYNLDKTASKAAYENALNNLKTYPTVFVALHDMSRYASKNHGLTQEDIELIYKLQKATNVVLVVLGSPYSLDKFEESQTVVVAYQENEMTQSLCAQMLFGAIAAKGRLPIGVGQRFTYGEGYDTHGGLRLQYTIPEDVGIRAEHLRKIDTLALDAIKNGATPGCQILVAKDGKVIFEKAYGYHSYSKKQPVLVSDIYDLASITKVAATLPTLMKMYDEKELDLDHTLGHFFPNKLKKSNKKDLKVRNILTHQARLISWIPFYTETLAPKVYKKIYSKTPTEKHTVKVAENMYMDQAYMDTLWKILVDSDLRSRWGYKYSDLGYYFFHKIIEDYAKEPMANYVNKTLYAPLGMNLTTYNPREKFDKDYIVPTEKDTKFRHQLLDGYVHDMGAGMLGGVCGHAGLFGNSNDLAKLLQMYLNGGTYGNRVYLEPTTIELFAKKQNNSCRRGLGFDKPELANRNTGPTSANTSPSTYGHTGFTGTCAWADPDYNMIYIFLANRIHPNMNNRTLLDMDTRTKIQSVIYKALQDPIEDSTQ